jgi:hypothetical protein
MEMPVLGPEFLDPAFGRVSVIIILRVGFEVVDIPGCAANNALVRRR